MDPDTIFTSNEWFDQVTFGIIGGIGIYIKNAIIKNIYYDPKNSYSKQNIPFTATHNDISALLLFFRRIFKNDRLINPEFFKFKPQNDFRLFFKEILASGAKIKRDSYNPSAIPLIPFLYFTSNINTFAELRSYILTLKDLQYRDFGREGFDAAGRVSISDKVMSFWNDQDIVIKQLQPALKVLQAINMPAMQTKFYTLDQEMPFTINDLSSKQKSTRTREEIKTLMQKQHLDPNAKKALDPEKLNAGSRKQGKVADAAGFPNVASFKAHYKYRQSESILKEAFGINPADWIGRYGVITFAYRDGVFFYSNNIRMYHSDMQWKVFDDTTETINSSFSNRKIANYNINNIIHRMKDIETFPELKNDPEKFKEYLDKNAVEIFQKGWFFRGRILKTAIAFWEDMDKITPHFHEVFDFLKHININYTNIDYVFRDTELKVPYNKLKLPQKRASAAELKKRDLIMRQHLDPNAKKALDPHKLGAGSRKQGKVAAAAGFPNVASFKDRWQSESFDI